MSECHSFPAAAAVAVLGLGSLHLGAGPPVPLSPSPGKWAPSGVLSLEHNPQSPIQREIVLLPGSGSSFPATNQAFMMRMHLFIRAGFIFMEKLLWAGVVLGESVGLLPCARSCHCGCGCLGTRATKPWAGMVPKAVLGLCVPAGFCVLLVCVSCWVSLSCPCRKCLP